jgi:Cleft lip and palate transmembrane protein 1 (CLPTM1)
MLTLWKTMETCFFAYCECAACNKAPWACFPQGKEISELKRVFLEGNPYLLALTFVVSLLHSVFDMLAFKNDIGFWKNNKSMEGLSARSVMINAFCQVVIFFYLLDNETSVVVLGSAGAGIHPSLNSHTAPHPSLVDCKGL